MAQFDPANCKLTIWEIDHTIQELKSQYAVIRGRSKQNKRDQRMLDMEYPSQQLQIKYQANAKEKEQIHLDGKGYFTVIKPEIRRLRDIRSELVKFQMAEIRAEIKKQKIARAMSDSREERAECKRKIKKIKAKICTITSHINETTRKSYLLTELRCDRCKEYYPYTYKVGDAW